MPRSEKQKLKLHYIIEYFKKYTDEEHPVTVNDIIEYLESEGIQAERKSIYRDIEAMCELGYDIVQIHDKRFSYYLGSRIFETAELRMLVDAVQASRSITKTKSSGLIKKLESLTTVYDAERLHSKVFVTNRVKSANESIYYNVDCINRAIEENRQISFLYFDWDIKKSRVYRRGGARYEVSPWSLVWDNEFYYLIAFDSSLSKLRHYRVDRMTDIEQTVKEQEGKEVYSDIDTASYAKRFFGMYNGDIITVTLGCDADLANAVIDRFGNDLHFLPQKDGKTFHVRVNVAVSPVFLSWVFEFGGRVRILSPEWVRTELKNMAAKFLE